MNFLRCNEKGRDSPELSVFLGVSLHIFLRHNERESDQNMSGQVFRK